jgi:hypothetical protein
MFRSARIVLAAMLAAAPMAAQAQAPNLSGSWQLDAAKSDLGPMAQMFGGETPKITMVIDHKEPSVSIKTTTETPRGARTADQALTTDGKEVTTTGPRGGTSVTTAKWEGTTLVVTSKRSTPQGELMQKQMLTLSADGKTLTANATAQTPMGEFSTTQVFVKQ